MQIERLCRQMGRQMRLRLVDWPVGSNEAEREDRPEEDFEVRPLIPPGYAGRKPF